MEYMRGCEKNTRLPKGENEKWHIPRGKNKKNGEYMDWVCKVSKSELLMTLPNATGKLKPFPFEFCLWGNILSKGVAYRPLQLNTLESEQAHTHPDTHANLCASSYTLLCTYTLLCYWLISINQNYYMHDIRGIRKDLRDTLYLCREQELPDICFSSSWLAWLSVWLVTCMSVYSADCWSFRKRAILINGY